MRWRRPPARRRIGGLALRVPAARSPPAPRCCACIPTLVAPVPFRSSARRSARTCGGRRSATGSATPSWSARSRTARPIATCGTPTGVLARALIASGIGPRDRVGIWSPNRYEWVITQYRHRAHRRHPREHQPRLQVVRAAVCPAAVRGAACSSSRVPSGPRTTWHCSAEVRRDCPDLHESIVLEDGLGRAPRAEPPGQRGRAGGARGRAAVRRPDQHPVHVGHDRLPEGRDAVASQHPQQRLLHRRHPRLRRDGPRVHPGAVLPLLRHGARQPGLHHAWRLHGDPRRGLRPRHGPRGGRRGAVHGAVRRPDHVHRRAGITRASPDSTCRRCAPGSWPARRARSR